MSDPMHVFLGTNSAAVSQAWPYRLLVKITVLVV